MNDDQFDRLMKDAAETYRRPPQAPLNEMWAAIESEHFGVSIAPRSRRSLLTNPWVRMAAVLVLGVAIGRVSTRTSQQPASATEVAAAQPDADSYELTTNRYLGETVTLLAALPKQLETGRDSAFIGRASHLLTTTRLLMDAPSSADPRLHRLLEDLELVLAQVVQMPTGRHADEAKLIRQALQERDVMPRLRDAVADNPN